MKTVKVGDTGTLTRCKHRWHNGLRVKILKVRRPIDVDGLVYEAVGIGKERSPLGKEITFLLGEENFVPDVKKEGK